MDHLKRVFQCLSPSTYPRNSQDVSRMEDSSSEPVKNMVDIFQPHYKQQHLASLAENQAVFELQKQYLEKRIQYINIQIEKFDRFKIPDLGQKILQIEEQCGNIEGTLEILKGDAEWVKFE